MAESSAKVSPIREKEIKEEKQEESTKEADQTKEEDSVQAGLEEKKEERNIGLVLDLPLRVSAELGRTRIAVRDLLNMGQGSVIELNKLAGEPMEIFVNDKLVAKGEAVVVNEKFGVRLIDIISPTQRVEQLK